MRRIDHDMNEREATLIIEELRSWRYSERPEPHDTEPAPACDDVGQIEIPLAPRVPSEVSGALRQ